MGTPAQGSEPKSANAQDFDIKTILSALPPEYAPIASMILPLIGGEQAKAAERHRELTEAIAGVRADVQALTDAIAKA